MEQVFFHGLICTMDSEQPMAQAVLIRDGRFAWVGTDEEVLAMAAPGALLHDLQGAAAYPGLIDSHLHILNHAMASRELELNGMRIRGGALEAIAERVSSLAEGAALDGRGFNEDLWDDPRLPLRRELDAIAPRTPVRLTRICGHLVIANTCAMQQSGVTASTAAPEGGMLDYERGIFAETAIGLLYPSDQDAGVASCMELLEAGMSMAADAGLTAIFTDDFGTGGYTMATVTEAYRTLEAQGRMPVRVVQQCAMPTDESLKAFLHEGYHYLYGSDMYRLGARKLYADGSLGARTAWLSEPYADRPETCGVPTYTQQELNRLAEEAHRAGLPVIVHAIGDAAVSSVLDAIGYARRALPGTDKLPDGIVHCQITTPELLKRIAREHVCVYAQPVFAEYDLHICRDRVGARREESSYAWATLLRSGVCVSSGSDCPVEPLSPVKNIYCAVARRDFDHQPPEGWLLSERLTLQEALRCHTVEAARAASLEDRLGRIRAGYLADMTVFPKPLGDVPVDELPDQKPLMTVLGGRVRACPAR